MLSAAQQELQAKPLHVAEQLQSASSAREQAFTCCTFDPSGSWLIAGLRSCSILYYSLAAGAVIHTSTLQHVPRVCVRDCARLGFITCDA